MRVLHVISTLDLEKGGPTQTLLDFSTAQAKMGMSVSICSQGISNDTVERLVSHDINVVMAGPGYTPLKWAPDLSNKLKQLIADASIVHIHGVWEEIQHRAARLAQELGKPYIIRPAGMLDPWSLAQSSLRKRFYRWWRLQNNLDHAAAIHYTAEKEKKLAEPLEIKAPAIIEPNGIDTNDFESLPTRQTLDRWMPSLTGRKVILFLSRIHHKKGLELLLKAFSEITDNSSALLIVGSGEADYINTIKQLTRQLAIEDRVVFTGFLRDNDKKMVLACADLFVLPSYQENFGVAIIEALACGTPVVISDQINICDDVAKAEAGQVLPLGAEPLRVAIDQWLANDALREQAGQRGAAWVRKQYDWQVLAKRWMNHYESLAK